MLASPRKSEKPLVRGESMKAMNVRSGANSIKSSLSSVWVRRLLPRTYRLEKDGTQSLPFRGA